MRKIFAGLHLACGTFLILFAPLHAVAQCTTSGGTITCAESGDFTTTQSSLGLGMGGQVSFSDTIGTSWNQSGSAGSIYQATVEGVNLGNYGATVSGSTSGNISLSVNAQASAGSVTANIPASVNLQLPSSVHPGDNFTVSAPSLTYGSGVGFTTTSPGVGFSVGLGFDAQASVGATVCAGGCAGFGNTNLIDTGQQSLTILQYNEQQQGAQLVVGGGQVIALGQNVTSQVGGSGSKDIIPGVLALTYDLNPGNLSFSSASTASGSGTYTASGMTPDTVLGLDLNAVNAVTSAVGLPPLSGNLGDFVCSDLGVPCGSTVQNVLNSVGYNLVAADATVGISPSQQYTMNVANGGYSVSLQMEDQNGNALGNPVTLNAADNYNASLTYPTQASGVTSISLVPTLTLADPTFTTQTGLTVVPGFTLSGLGLSAGPLSLGPLSISPSIPPIPQLTLSTQTFALQMTNGTETLASTSTIGANITQAAGTGISTYIDFQVLNATGYSVTYSAGDNAGNDQPASLYIHDSTLTGGTFNGSANASVTISSDSNLTNQTVLNGVTVNSGASNTIGITAASGLNVTINNSTFNLGSQSVINTNGNVALNNSTMQNAAGLPASAGSQLNVQTGTLAVSNSTVTNQYLNISPGATVTMQSSSMTGDLGMIAENQAGATLTLNGSTFTVPDNNPLGAVSPQTCGFTNATALTCQAFLINSTVNLLNGSTFHVGKQDILGIENSGNFNTVINIGAGSLLQSDYETITGGTVNIATGGTLTLSNLLGGSETMNVNNAGGTVNLNGFTGNQAGSLSIYQSGAMPAGVVNIYGGSQLGFESGFVFNGMSVVNVSGSSGLVLLASSSTAALNIDSTSGVGVWNGTLTANTIVNNGGLGVSSITPSLSGAAISANTILNYGQLGGNFGEISANVINYGTISTNTVGGGTVQFTNVINQGGSISLGTFDTLAVTGQLTQITGSMLLDGALTASNPVMISGGTVSGTGTIDGSLVNDGGILSPGDIAYNGDLEGSLTITGDYTQGGGGTLLVDIDGEGDITQLIIDGDADLAGTLEIEIDANFLSALEDDPTFYLGRLNLDFLSYGSLTSDSQFTDVEFVDSSLDPVTLPFGYTFEDSDPAGSLDLSWIIAPDCGPLAQSILDGDATLQACTQFPPGTVLSPPSGFTPPEIMLTQAPEPGSFFVFACGLAAIGALAFRKRGRAADSPE